MIEKFIEKNKKIFSYNEFECIDTQIDTEKFKNLFLKMNSEKIKSRKDFIIKNWFFLIFKIAVTIFFHTTFIFGSCCC